MHYAYLFLVISGFAQVHAELVTISVKKTVTVEATVTVNGTVTKERLSNILIELQKEVCLNEDECRRAEGNETNGTTYNPHHYTNISLWDNTDIRNFGSLNHTTEDHAGTIITPSVVKEEKPMFDCSELPAVSPSGVYNISSEHGAVEVFCDMDTDGGRWTVIQNNNISSPLNMDKSWQEYKKGFGTVKDVFWLGNEQISFMTTKKQYHLRIDMTDSHGERIFAKYAYFRVYGEQLKFKLFVGGYFSGTAGHGLVHQDGRNFSTSDANSDFGNPCPKKYRSGWWWNRYCEGVDLNSYQPRWIGTQLRTTEMKIRSKRERRSKM